MQQVTLINNVRNRTARVLNLVEQAQAEAAAAVQEWNKLGGATFLTGFVWDDLDITAQQFTDAVASLGSAMPDILGAHGTNLYTIKS